MVNDRCPDVADPDHDARAGHRPRVPAPQAPGPGARPGPAVRPRPRGVPRGHRGALHRGAGGRGRSRGAGAGPPGRAAGGGGHAGPLRQRPALRGVVVPVGGAEQHAGQRPRRSQPRAARAGRHRHPARRPTCRSCPCAGARRCSTGCSTRWATTSPPRPSRSTPRSRPGATAATSTSPWPPRSGCVTCWSTCSSCCRCSTTTSTTGSAPTRWTSCCAGPGTGSPATPSAT